MRWPCDRRSSSPTSPPQASTCPPRRACSNLLQDLRASLGLSLLLITHDLNMVGYVADRIAVMSRGKIVETGTPEQVMDSPQHPYTRKLLASILELPTDAGRTSAGARP